MTRPARILLVTAGLSAAGTLLGALTGAAALFLSLVFSSELHGLHAGELALVLGLPALVGGVLGGTVGPAVAWALLRDVPLGVAFVVTSVGTALGGIVGWYAGGTHDVLVAMYGAVIGFVLSAILLRLRHPARQRASV